MKQIKILLFIFLLFGVASVAAQETVSVSTAELADVIVRESEKYAGVPYHMGATGPRAFDCSGFVRYIYAKFGFDLPHSSGKMYECGTPVEGSMSELQKGDLVFFNGRRRGGGVGHVGIYIGPDGKDGSFTFIHAAVRGGVQVSHLSEEYYSSRFVGACRILPCFHAALPEPVDCVVPLPVETVERRRDTLKLGPGDRRIIIFESGNWAMVDEDGSLCAPDTDTRIVLNSNGSWSPVKMSIHTIPSLAPAAAAHMDTIVQAAQVAQTEPASSSTVEQAPVPEVQYHTVKKGESLYSISKKYGTSVNSICKLNDMSAKSVLKIGKKLRVK